SGDQQQPGEYGEEGTRQIARTGVCGVRIKARQGAEEGHVEGRVAIARAWQQETGQQRQRQQCKDPGPLELDHAATSTRAGTTGSRYCTSIHWRTRAARASASASKRGRYSPSAST